MIASQLMTCGMLTAWWASLFVMEREEESHVAAAVVLVGFVPSCQCSKQHACNWIGEYVCKVHSTPTSSSLHKRFYYHGQHNQKCIGQRGHAIREGGADNSIPMVAIKG